jgi:hypothetical protein
VLAEAEQGPDIGSFPTIAPIIAARPVKPRPTSAASMDRRCESTAAYSARRAPPNHADGRTQRLAVDPRAHPFRRVPADDASIFPSAGYVRKFLPWIGHNSTNRCLRPRPML